MPRVSVISLVASVVLAVACDVPEEPPPSGFEATGGAGGGAPDAAAGGRSAGGMASSVDAGAGGSFEMEAGTDGNGAGGYQGSTACVGETRAPTFERGLEVEGRSVSVRVVAARPLPPIVGTNEWTLHVEDAVGKPVTGARVTVSPFMPDHGHGSPTRTVVREVGAGDYRLTSLFFSMPGYWETRVKVTVAGDSPDAASDADAGLDTAAVAPAIEEQVVVKVCVEFPGL